ncbi:phasin family protein [Rhodovulum sp. FJ3]|uniref:phasin family protein n=1 Tax=Rhodovulum sp. FJ3 TaxID=3079053 RepID=UPI00293DD837|nr:phasin family protein [Rhodovulum sp. FJ3]MDV4166906.1 phasin family protein [Rhodovulum sp. FJ3]
MATATDFNKTVQDMMASFSVDTKSFEDAFKTSAAMGEKMSKVALEAADKSTELASKWTKDTIAQLGAVTKVKADPADYSKAVTDFASTSAEAATENMAAFAEIAKKVQMETVELMLAAGKDFSEDATAAVKKATEEATAAAKKATAASK